MDNALISRILTGIEVLTQEEIAAIYETRESCDYFLENNRFTDFRQHKKHTKGELFYNEKGDLKLTGGHIKSQLMPGIICKKIGVTPDGLDLCHLEYEYNGQIMSTESVMFPLKWSIKELERKCEGEIQRKKKSGYFGRQAKRSQHNDVLSTTIQLSNGDKKTWTILVYRPQILNGELVGIEVTSVYPKNKL